MPNFEVSQSRVRAWRRCRRQYGYDFVQKIQPKRPRIQLIRGTIIGECLDEATKRKPNIESVLKPYTVKYKNLFAEEREVYGTLLDDVRGIVGRYRRLYQNDGLKYTKYGSEVELKFDLTKGITFSAHLDKYPQDSQGRWWVQDHKTHKKIPTEEDRFSDIQLTLYHWAAPLAGLPQPIGVMWDYIRTKMPTVPEVLVKGGLTRRKDIDTDYETYMGAIKENGLNPGDYAEILGRLKAEGQSQFFHRVWLPKPNPNMVSTLVQELILTALDMKAHHEDVQPRTMTTFCKSCKFFTLCQAELRGLDTEFVRKSEYEPKPEDDDAEEEE